MSLPAFHLFMRSLYTILRRMPFNSPSVSTFRTSSTFAIPRPSASLVIINDHNEILLVQRNTNASAYGGMHVFPGGNMDEMQDASLEMTAIRETFEESGLLLASSISGPSFRLPSDVVLEKGRHAVHQRTLQFNTFLQSNGLRADTGSLLPFTQWVSPVGHPRRFKTQFYVAFLPEARASSLCSGPRTPMRGKAWSPAIFVSGLSTLQRHTDFLLNFFLSINLECLPLGASMPVLNICSLKDGRQEVVGARFVHPRRALKECCEGKIDCMPPQFYILSTLADILHDSLHTIDQRKKVEALSSGAFGQMTINAQILGREQDGQIFVTLEGDETRGAAKGRLHRILVLDKGGVLAGFAMQRNFDIFTEIDS